MKIQGQNVTFSSPEDLIIHKIFAGRPRDLEDVGTILRKNPDVDIHYIRGWLEQFDSSSEGRNYLSIFNDLAKELLET